jgi:succinate-semialdehyde dehydrogenase/glutarate-semialdehyde dehydrogenase
MSAEAAGAAAPGAGHPAATATEAATAPGGAGPPDGLVRLRIGGAEREGGAGRLDVLDPATGEPAFAVALADEADLDDALAAAAAAFPAWSRTPAAARGSILRRAAALLAERTEPIAAVLTRESGKLLAESRGELARAVETLDWNGGEAGRIGGRLIEGLAPGARRELVPVPLGVVAAFTAWNFPAVLLARKLGAALAAGCTVVLKASEETPATAAAIVAALEDAGLPPGAVNLVFGDPPRVSRHLLASPVVRALTFTGSTAVGRQLAALAGSGLNRMVLELGGHAPVIVCEDADVDAAVTATLPAKFGTAGQSCVAPSRFYVHESLYETFAARFAERAAALTIGPLIGARRVQAMERLTADAVERGARVLTGGERPAGPGFFFPPTVLAGVPDSAEVMREEPFGPIAPIAPFATWDEALARANALPYGLAAYVFTGSLAVDESAARDLEAGNLGINQMAPSLPDAPLGGIDQSGLGYEGGTEGVRAFLHMKLVNRTAA